MMFPYKTSTTIEQQERKADLTYLDAQLALKANLSGATTTGAYQMTAGLIAGENTVELTGVDINGTIYNSYLQVTNVGTAHEAQLILNRHSTTLQPLVLGVRSNSETTAEAAVTAGQELLSLWGAGYAGTNHKLFGRIDLVVGTGTISGTSSPGKFIVRLTPDGAVTPVEVFSIDSNASATFAGSVTFASASFTSLSVSGVSSFADGTVGAPSITNIGNTNTGMYFSAADTMDFACGGVNALKLTATAATFAGSVSTSSIILGGVTLLPTGTELNYVDGVTSAIQTQLNDKQPLDSDLTAIAALTGTSGFLKTNGAGTWSVDTATYSLSSHDHASTYVDTSGDTMTGALGITAGSAGAPSLFFSGASNTGVFQYAADKLGLSCGGTNLVVASATGFGIGSDPSYRLHVVGGSNTVAAFIRVEGALPDNDDNAGLYVYHAGTSGTAFRMRTDSALTSSYFVDIVVNNAAAGPNSALFVRHYGTGDIQRWSGASGTERMRVTNGGNLALAALGKLYLDGVTAAGDTYIVESAANTMDLYAGGAKELSLTATGATVLGAFGCNSKAAQTAYASGGALAAYAAGANGLDTGANMSALHALVVNIRAALVANGIMS